MVPVVLSKETFSVLVQIEQKQTGDMKFDEPSWFDIWADSLGDDMISLSLQPSSSNNQSP